MSTRPKMRRQDEPRLACHAPKDFEEVAERVFRDDAAPESLYGDILDEAADEAA